MSRGVIFAWNLGVAESRDVARSPLGGFPGRSIFWPLRFSACALTAESSMPSWWPRLSHPSWFITKEQTAWGRAA